MYSRNFKLVLFALSLLLTAINWGVHVHAIQLHLYLPGSFVPAFMTVNGLLGLITTAFMGLWLWDTRRSSDPF